MIILFDVSLVLATILMMALFHPKFRNILFEYEDIVTACGAFVAVAMVVSGIDSFVISR